MSAKKESAKPVLKLYRHAYTPVMFFVTQSDDSISVWKYTHSKTGGFRIQKVFLLGKHDLKAGKTLVFSKPNMKYNAYFKRGDSLCVMRKVEGVFRTIFMTSAVIGYFENQKEARSFAKEEWKKSQAKPQETSIGASLKEGKNRCTVFWSFAMYHSATVTQSWSTFRQRGIKAVRPPNDVQLVDLIDRPLAA